MSSITWFLLALSLLSVNAASISGEKQIKHCKLDNWTQGEFFEYGRFKAKRNYSIAEEICDACDAIIVDDDIPYKEEIMVLELVEEEPFWLYKGFDAKKQNGTDSSTCPIIRRNENEEPLKWVNCSKPKEVICMRPRDIDTNIDFTDDSWPDTDYTDDSWPDTDYTDDSWPDTDYTDDSWPDTDYTDDSSPDTDYTDDSSPDTDYTDSSPDTDFSKVSTPDNTTDASSNTTERASDFKHTILLVHFETQPGDYVFIRGGFDRDNCGNKAEDDNHCVLPMKTLRQSNMSANYTAAYDAWREGDNFLDWYGKEAEQGYFQGIPAGGTPAIWTTNDTKSESYHPLNEYGPHYWLLEADLDCSRTENGTFLFKAYLVHMDTNEGHWNGCEQENIKAKCGTKNVVHNNGC